MKTVLITGGSSRIGRTVADKLKADFRLIFLINQHEVSLPGTDVETLTGGLAAAPAHAKRIQTADIILHLAGVTHADTDADYMMTNQEGTQHLLSACRKNQPFIYVSTRCVGKESGGYGYSKLLAEQAIAASGLRATIIRPAEVYGSKTGEGGVGREGIDALLTIAKQYQVLPDFRWSPEVTYSPISVEELVTFIAKVVHHPPQEYKIYTLCNDHSYTIRDILPSLRKGLGKQILRLPVPIYGLLVLQAFHIPLPFKPDQLARLVLPKVDDNSLAKQDYAFSPVSFLHYLENGLSTPSS